jgi:transcriptional regulator with XRE-family HTH domain
MSTVSDTIREAVRASTRSRADIARGAGIPDSALSRFVSDGRGISIPNLDALAAHLGLRLVKGRTVKATKAGKRSTKGAK